MSTLHLKSKTLLLVDDDEGILDFLMFLFKNIGYDVATCRDVRSAMKWLEKNTANLVLLDIMMPDTHGLELCKWMRTKNNKTPVIIMTALDDEETANDAMAVGAVDFIKKPFNINELKMKVNTHLDEDRAVQVQEEKSEDKSE
ncbi:response regulator [Elusimicrobiota bacterium]